MEQVDAKIAFGLQIQEVLLASSLHAAGISSNAAHLPDDVVSGGSSNGFTEYENEAELMKHGYEVLVDAELERARLDLSRQVHDRAIASQMVAIPEEDWSGGGNLKRPYDEGSSSSSNEQVFRFRVYFKGLVDKDTMVGGIGVAICDPIDGLMFEISKGLSANEHEGDEERAEMKALIDGLNAALMLDLKNILLVTDNPSIHQCITSRKHTVKVSIAAFADEVNLLLREFADLHASLVTNKDVKSADEHARNAIALRVGQSGGNGNEKKTSQTCLICFEDTFVDHMFLINGCLHSYCFSCMSKHVQFKLLQGVLPKCPHGNCNTNLQPDSCKKFLTPELFDIMSQRVKEASIPAKERIYCPNPRCSALFSKTEIQGSKTPSTSNAKAKKCSKCHVTFCIKCKVPWHDNMTCSDYKRTHPEPTQEDKKLKSLAAKNLWRQCPKCSNMVSLARGCYHIYCRCGHEFCYICGARWINKNPSCNCPLWDERNIIYR